jgi:hypothetical protein
MVLHCHQVTMSAAISQSQPPEALQCGRTLAHVTPPITHWHAMGERDGRKCHMQHTLAPYLKVTQGLS